ncbi:hypothetical protein ALQ47_200059 [Pseudomonas cichorii]|nr:hypothetical protein ALQ47_200059 [Pseudomonas cichorii]
MQALWEITTVCVSQRLGGEKADATFAQLLAVALDVQMGGHRAVGNHQVQALDRQIG